MTTLPDGIRRAFRLARRRPAIEEEVDAEVAFHLDMRAAELVARGLSPEAARAEARRRFGDTRKWSAAMSEVDRTRVARERRAEWLEDLGQDLRYAARALLRTPLFTLLAVVTLALGIGANAAVFGVLKSVLLDALPHVDAERVVQIHSRRLDGTIERGPISAATARDVTERQRSFERVATFESRTRELIFGSADGAEPSVVHVEYAEPALFRALGVSAAAGRLLADDDADRDTTRSILLTHAAWQRLLGGDPGVVGRDVYLNGIARTVVGVLPRGFVGPVPEAEIYFPISLRPFLRDPVMARIRHNFGMVGRLRPGVTAEAAQRELSAIFADLARAHPNENGGEGVTALPMREALMGDTRTPLLVLMASAGLVLLITCANLAGALLSRTLSRRKELAVRASLGAGRGRLVRQLLTESTLLALAGGALGVGLAALALMVLRRLALPSLPPYAELALDPGALLFTSALALATGVGFGIAPALAASRADVQGTLRDAGRASSEGARSRRLRGLLVAGQLALCVSLVAGAGLLVRSLLAMTALPLGFDPRGVLAVAVQLPRAGYSSNAARVQFLDRAVERLRALPGVTGVASVGQAPTRVTNRNGFVVDGGAPQPADTRSIMLLTEVSDDYFRMLGIPLLEGRTFGPEDHGPVGAPPSIVISRRVARQYWPAGGAVGARVRMGPQADAPRATIVGVVGDVRNDPAQPDPEPIQYMSIRTNPWNGPVLLVRTRGEPLALVPSVRRAIAALDPGVAVQQTTTVETILAEGLSGRRLPVVLMAAFGALALVLASVGVYALFAAMAAAREREFGVRVALGSTRAEIAALVLRQGGAWMALGLAGGALGVALVGRLVRGLLYGVRPLDPVTLGLTLAALLACAAVALFVPVRRATRADPITVLRQ